MAHQHRPRLRRGLRRLLLLRGVTCITPKLLSGNHRRPSAYVKGCKRQPHIESNSNGNSNRNAQKGRARRPDEESQLPQSVPLPRGTVSSSKGQARTCPRGSSSHRDRGRIHLVTRRVKRPTRASLAKRGEWPAWPLTPREPPRKMEIKPFLLEHHFFSGGRNKVAGL